MSGGPIRKSRMLFEQCAMTTKTARQQSDAFVQNASCTTPSPARLAAELISELAPDCAPMGLPLWKCADGKAIFAGSGGAKAAIYEEFQKAGRRAVSLNLTADGAHSRVNAND